MIKSNARVGWWNVETVQREREMFLREHGSLEGRTQAQLMQAFGQPNEFVYQGYRRTMNSIVTLVADLASYHSLLPHTTVEFVIYQDCVHHVCFVPKVKSCSPQQQVAYGKMFAPD